MLSPRERGADLARFYTVTEPRRHPRGHTVYKVTARVSRRPPPSPSPPRLSAPGLPRVWAVEPPLGAEQRPRLPCPAATWKPL